MNYSHYSNPDVDALLAELNVEYDQQKRYQLATDIQQILLDDVAAINLGHRNLTVVTKANVQGVENHPTDYYWFTNRLSLE